MRSATYRAQCQTWAIAKELFGLGDAIRIDIERELKSEPNPLVVFRAKPEFRTAKAKELRRLVAAEIRKRRKQ